MFGIPSIFFIHLIKPFSAPTCLALAVVFVVVAVAILLSAVL